MTEGAVFANEVSHARGLGSIKYLEPIAYVSYIVLCFFAYQMSSLGSPACFDDCFGYIPLMGKSGGEYFHTLLTMFRPWAVPTFFSLFGPYDISSAARIVLAQSYIAFFSWLLFAFACQGLLATRALKFVGFVAISSLMFGQGYYHFNQFLLSDSLAMSSVLIQYALCLSFGRFAGFCEKFDRGGALVVLYLAVLLAVTAFEMATRDANVMLALSGVAFLLIANRNVTIGVEARWIFAMLVVVLAVGQSITARMRYRENAKNILVGAVFANEDMRRFFLSHGMPTAFDAAGARMKPQALDAVDFEEMTRVRNLLDVAAENPENEAFIGRVGGLYASYLLTHPEYVIGNVARYWRLIFTQTVDLDSEIIRGASGSSGARKFIRPGEATPFVAGASARLSVTDHIPPLVGAALLTLCALLPLIRPKDIWSWVPILLAAVGAGNAVLGFFGDVWVKSEMERHALVGSVVLRIALTLCVLRLMEEGRRRLARERRSIQPSM